MQQKVWRKRFIYHYINKQFIDKMTDYIQQQAELNASGEIINAQQILHTTRRRFWLGYATGIIPQNIIPRARQRPTNLPADHNKDQ